MWGMRCIERHFHLSAPAACANLNGPPLRVTADDGIRVSSLLTILRAFGEPEWVHIDDRMGLEGVSSNAGQGEERSVSCRGWA